MRTVYIVTRNKEVDMVFDNLEAARHHKAALVKKWAITEIVIRQVFSL